ncbi:hypothetical protein BaRGS_00004405, partial [Batillaria attramentaria]
QGNAEHKLQANDKLHAQTDFVTVVGVDTEELCRSQVSCYVDCQNQTGSGVMGIAAFILPLAGEDERFTIKGKVFQTLGSGAEGDQIRKQAGKDTDKRARMETAKSRANFPGHQAHEQGHVTCPQGQSPGKSAAPALAREIKNMAWQFTEDR